MKIQMVLQLKKQTPGTVVYAVAVPTSVAVGQVYVRKEHLEKVNGAWPDKITLTIEPGDTTEDETA